MTKAGIKYFFFLIFCFSVNLHAQNVNNWINEDQTYYKIGIARNGIYRITLADLSAAGVPVSSFNAENIQIFYKGNEIPIRVKKSAGALNYLEFYGERNTGWFDTELYMNSQSQTNPYYSQITDTSAYFLTWNNSTDNKRYTVAEYDDNGAVTVENGQTDALVQFTGAFYTGKEFPLYDQSKGWFDNQAITLGNSRTKTLPLPDIISNGNNINIATAVVSFGDASSLGDNHHLQIELPNGNIFDTTFAGKTAVKKQFAVNTSALSESNSIIYSSIDDLGVATDKMAVAYIQANYPASFSLATSDYRSYKVANNSNNQLITLQGPGEEMQPLVLDTANHQMASPQYNGTDWQFTLPPSSNQHFIAIQKEAYSPAYINYTNTDLPAISGNDYTIITHPSLVSGATTYANYRNAQLFTTDALYNHFAYGLKKHPLALRNFLKYYNEENGSLPQYLLLMGKSISINYSRQNATNFTGNLVPTMGYPAADNIIACQITNENSYKPELAISRLAVQTNEDINQYLSKIQANEAQPAAQWMKNIVHFGGGINEAEQTTFESYLANYRQIIEDTLMGAHVSTFLKNSSAPIQITASDSIRNLINSGTTLLTFFGHGYSGGFDQDIDEPAAYNNQGKYPMMLANSCYSGNVHLTGSSSASEKWVLIPDKGAIAFLASVSQGYPGLLNKFSSRFYKNMAYLQYGNGIGKMVQAAVTDQVQQASTNLDINSALTFTLHGDPAWVPNQFDEPDIVLQNDMVQIEPKEVTTVLDSFAVKFTAANTGKTITKDINYLTTQTFPDGSDTSFVHTASNLYFRDTITQWLPVERQKGAGLNIIQITGDYLQLIDEADEMNNQIEIPVNVKSTNLFPVYPYPFAQNTKDTIILRASTGDPFIDKVQAKIEIDTTASFDSPLKKSIERNFDGGVIEWNTQMTPLANQTYYWRTGKKNEEDVYEWQQKSFTCLTEGKGWMQNTFKQISDNDLQLIYESEGILHYQQTPRELKCHNVGSPSDNQLNNIYYSINNNRTNAACGASPNMVVAVIDSTDFSTWAADHGDYGQINYPQCFSFNYPHALFVFSSTTISGLDNMMNFINNIIPEGQYMLVYSFRNGYFESWENRHFVCLENLGAEAIRGIPNAYPYILFAQKGFPNEAIEVVGDSETDIIDLSVNLQDNFDYGSVITDWIGPAKNWDNISWNFSPGILETEDTVKIDIISKSDTRNKEITLFEDLPVSASPVDISEVDPEVHPYLKIKFFTRDKTNKTPAYPRKIQCNYSPQSDIAISPGNAYNFYADSLQEGEELQLKLAYRNVSDIESEPTSIHYQITDISNESVASDTSTIGALNEGSFAADSIKFSTTGLHGYHTLWVDYNQNSAKDFYTFNNLGSIPFYVYTDETGPLLDVTFDGRHILNGEIISASPVIKITLKDENPYLSLNDTSLFALYLTPPGGEEQRISLAPNIENGTIVWQPGDENGKKASITYMPHFQHNGIYELRVQARDASDNLSGAQDYQIQFEVINESTITHIFNYPNPFSTSTRFVFTLTGSRIPDQMSIDIYTVSGKHVRRIEMEELGPVYIGKNITEFAWNGTDEFGDRLANGVYLYKVTVRIDGQKVEMRSTEADHFFKKGWGKMYLMR